MSQQARSRDRSRSRRGLAAFAFRTNLDRARARRRIGGRERGTEDPFRVIVEVARIELALCEQSFDLMRERNGLASQPGAHRDTQIESRLDVIELRALHEAIERCRDLGAAQRARAVVILPAKDRTSRGSLRSVVVERDVRVGVPDIKNLKRCVGEISS